MNDAVSRGEAAPRSVAVIGSGGAGLSAAYTLSRSCEVTLYEAAPRFGGHARTVEVADRADVGLQLDVGFMVLNGPNYPTLHRLLARLGGIALGESEMSFGFHCSTTGVQYALNLTSTSRFSRNINLALPARSDPRFVGLLKDIAAFCRSAGAHLERGELGDQTLADYVRARGFSRDFEELYILPMGAALWSTPPAQILGFPAESFIRFFSNHGLLSLEGGPAWSFIRGGSRTYVDAIVRHLGDRALAGVAPRVERRSPDGVTLRLPSGEARRFDHVVIATHADEALALLDEPTADERRLLGAFRYQRNEAVLHTWEGVMPADRRCWASWNYEREDAGDPTSMSVTYHLNRLQGHHDTARSYFLSLNRRGKIPEEHVLQRFSFTHPIYSREAMRAQRDLPRLDGVLRTSFCGSYFGFGFHEDAVRSGVEAARSLGVEL
ncbi:FAD-dependent oxidoreductase [Sorangium sp. So ce269]